MPDGASWNTPATQQAWTALANQMQPSQGPYSGGFSKGGTSSGGNQWLRQISLAVYSSTGGGQQQQGLELAQLRTTFNVHKNTITTPNILDAKVFNLSPQTMSKITQFGRIQLSAGYKFAQYGLIFDGQVIQYRIGRENPTDTYMEIKAADGELLNSATSFHRFEAGTKESVPLQQFVKDIGIPAGFISAGVGIQTLLRPLIVAGNTRKYMRDLMLKYNANCFAENGQLHVVQQREYLPGEAVVLSPQTGLINIPETTPEGIQIRCLLNPRLKVGGLVKLDKKFISGIAYVPGGQTMTYAQGVEAGALNYEQGGVPVPVPTSPTGTYKIYNIEVSGDTRGQPWYMDLICLGVDSSGNTIGTAIPGTVYQRNPLEGDVKPDPGA